MTINISETNFFDLLSSEASLEGESLFLKYGGETANVMMEDRTITARDGYQIPIRIFNADINVDGPVLVMYPGGGYVMNMFEACSIACSRIADYSKLKVILINYRLTPEYPMPTPIMDALDATSYIFNHADEFSLDTEKLIIGGFSIGAHCAAVISNLAHKNKYFKVKNQILLNGAYDAFLTTREYAEYEHQDKMVSREGIAHIYKMWGLPDDILRTPLYSPYYENNLDEKMKTTIIVGEHDGMRSDSENYFLKLTNNGSRVSKIILSGQCHHTILLRAGMAEKEDPALEIANVFRLT